MVGSLTENAQRKELVTRLQKCPMTVLTPVANLLRAKMWTTHNVIAYCRGTRMVILQPRKGNTEQSEHELTTTECRYWMQDLTEEEGWTEHMLRDTIVKKKGEAEESKLEHKTIEAFEQILRVHAPL